MPKHHEKTDVAHPMINHRANQLRGADPCFIGRLTQTTAERLDGETEASGESPTTPDESPSCEGDPFGEPGPSPPSGPS